MSLREMTPAEIAAHEAEHGHKVGEFLPQYPNPRANDEKLRCPSCLTREIASLRRRAERDQAMKAHVLAILQSAVDFAHKARGEHDQPCDCRRCAEAAFVSAGVRSVMRAFDEGAIVVAGRAERSR